MTRSSPTKKRPRVSLAGKLLGWSRSALRRLRQQPERVLLLKTGNDRLGDMILISGTLKHYRQLYAGCRLELACPDALVSLFCGCPHVDAVVPLNEFLEPYQGKTRPNRLNPGRYDRVISLRRTPRIQDVELQQSFRPAWCAGFIRDRILIEEPAAKEAEAKLDCAVEVPAQKPPVHELEMQAALLTVLGAKEIPQDSIGPEFWTGPEDATLIQGWLSGRDPEEPVVVCAPCGSHSIRDWKPERFQEVFRSLAPCTLVLTGLTADSQRVAVIGADSIPGIHLVNLIGQTTVPELVETVRRADLVIGMESAVAHIGIALKRPTLCLAGGGHWGRFVPWGVKDLTRILTNRLECFGCGWDCSRPTVECIQEIPAEAVIQQAKELLAVSNKEVQP